MKITSIKEDFEHYLKMMYPNLKGMSDEYRKQLKQAYYGCAAAIFMKLRDELPELTDDQGAEELEKLYQETVTYWNQFLPGDE